MRGLIYLLVAAVALCFFGCGKRLSEKAAEKLAEKAIEKQMEKDGGGKAKVDISNGKMSVKNSKGEEVQVDASGGAKIPDGFPKDVYVYEGAKITTSMKNGKVFSLIMESSDPAAKVIEKTKAKMTSNGWKETATLDTGGSTMLGYDKEPLKMTVNVASQDKKTMIILSIDEGKK